MRNMTIMVKYWVNLANESLNAALSIKIVNGFVSPFCPPLQ